MSLWKRIFGPRTWGPPGFTDAVAADLRGRGEGFDLHDGGFTLHRDGGVQRYGLTNLAQLWAQLPESERPSAIASHLDNTFRAERESADVAAKAATLDGVRSLLRAQLFTTGHEVKVSGRELADDLRLNLVYDLPNSVSSVPRDHIARWGVPLDELLDLGLANVVADPPPERESLPGGLVGLTSQTFFGSTHAVLLERHAAIEPYGALVVVPHRHTVVFHPIRTAEATLAAVQALIPLAIHLHAAGPGSISPSLYWRRRGEFVRLPAIVSDQGVNFVPPNEFVELLNRL